jgi:hypothetical protein
MGLGVGRWSLLGRVDGNSCGTFGASKGDEKSRSDVTVVKWSLFARATEVNAGVDAVNADFGSLLQANAPN